MARLKYFIGSLGPYFYNNDAAINDPDFAGYNQAGVTVEGQMQVLTPPAEDDHVVRLQDFDGRIFAALEVANIDNPTELGLYASVVGSVLMCYQVEVGVNQWTMYVFDSVVSTGADSPYVVSGSTGYWIAVGGKYNSMYRTALILGKWKFVATDTLLQVMHFDGTIWKEVSVFTSSDSSSA